jgi:hypothetical protein
VISSSVLLANTYATSLQHQDPSYYIHEFLIHFLAFLYQLSDSSNKNSTFSVHDYEAVPMKGMRMPRAQTARSSWERRPPRSVATWHPLGDLWPPSPSPPDGRRVQRGQCADWNTAGAPPSRYTARHVADSPAHRGS